MAKSATQQRETLAAASAVELGRILDDSLNEIYIFDAESLRFLQVNRGARQNLGYSMEQLRGLTPLDIKPDFTAQDFTVLIEPLQSGKRNKVEFETVHRRKNGTSYPVEVHLQLATFEGSPAFVAIILDTTERKRTEQTLQESEELHRITLANISDAVFMTDDTGRLRYVCPNVDVIFGYSEDEVAAMEHLADLLGDDVVDDQQLDASREIVNIERAIRDKDGNHHELLINVKRVAIRGGTRLYTCRDITRLKEAKDSLARAERLAAIGQMLTAMAHESANAIQRIQANTEMLQLDLEDAAVAAPCVSKIEKACGDLRSLLDEVRNYAAPIKLEYTACRVGELLDEAWLNLRTAWQARDAAFEMVLDTPDKTCRADRQRLVRVFRNLFENSLAVCADPVRIEVCGSTESTNGAQRLRIRVRDNGPGLNDEQKQKVFEPFFTTRPRGTGLGMAIAQRIVETHGGTIAVGEDDHAGAEFVIDLPG